MRDQESMRVHYWPDLLFNISWPENTKQGGSVCMDGRGKPITSSEQTATVKTIHGSCALGSGGSYFSQATHTFFLQFLCFAGVVTILCFRSQWLMHYHVTLISSDIFRSKWKRSLFVDFLH